MREQKEVKRGVDRRKCKTSTAWVSTDMSLRVATKLLENFNV